MMRPSHFTMAFVVCGLLAVAGPANAKVKQTSVEVSSLATGKHFPTVTIVHRQATLADPVKMTPAAPGPVAMPYPNVGGATQ